MLKFAVALLIKMRNGRIWMLVRRSPIWGFLKSFEYIHIQYRSIIGSAVLGIPKSMTVEEFFKKTSREKC